MPPDKAAETFTVCPTKKMAIKKNQYHGFIIQVIEETCDLKRLHEFPLKYSLKYSL